jgi:hypothetical protein
MLCNHLHLPFCFAALDWHRLTSLIISGFHTAIVVKLMLSVSAGVSPSPGY